MASNQTSSSKMRSSLSSHHPQPHHHQQQSQQQKQQEQEQEQAPPQERIEDIQARISRACDACRKLKVKCPITGSGPCRNCSATGRPCTFEDPGVKRDRPPTKREIKRLQSIVQNLETYLEHAAPHLDLSNLPSDSHQACEMVNAWRSQQVSQQPEPTPTNQRPSNQLSLKVRSMTARLISPPPEHLADLADHNTPLLEALHISYPPRGRIPDPICYPRSLMTEQYSQTLHALYVNTIAHLPPPDLAKSLLSAYFSKVNPLEAIIHEGEFRRHYESGLALRNPSFCSLCFAVFAAGSRFSQDIRVMPSEQGDHFPRQAAGAHYLAAGASLFPPPIIPCTLFDLQAMALLCYLMTCCCSTVTAWTSTTSFLKRAQAVGALRENSPVWKTSIMHDQLRKKAVWYLISREIQLCMCLGRASSINHNDLDLDFPFCISDLALTHLCDTTTSKQLPSSLHLVLHHPLDPVSLLQGFSALRTFFAVKKRFGCGLQKVLAKQSSPESKVWDWAREPVSNLARNIDMYCEHEVPVEVKWNPDKIDVQNLVICARLNGGALSLQISIHRLLISDEPLEIKFCLRASSALLDILEHVRNRGLLEETSSWSSYMVTQPALTFLYAACASHDCLLPADRADAWADVHRCINLLAALSPTTFLADSLRASLESLVQTCISEELFPDSSKLSPCVDKNAKKRNCTGELPGHPPPNKTAPSASSVGIGEEESAKGVDIFGIPASRLESSMFEFPGMHFGNGSSFAPESRSL